jgi:CheY-like chemotaxis protein
MPPTLATTILLVDDDPSLRRSLGRLLRAHAYEVLEAESALQALEMLAKSRPALMLMDMVMPGNSTLDTVRQIKADPSSAALPIIALTASPPTAPQDRALFTDVVAKPTDARPLLDAIAKALRASSSGSSTG